MLLITDRDPGCATALRGCTIVRLGDTLSRTRSDETIVCDVALDDGGALQSLREALAFHRRRPDTPVHFNLRDDSIVARAIANALGATSISIGCDVVADRHVDPARVNDGPARAVPTGIEHDVGVVAASLSRIFAAAVTRAPISVIDLDEGVAALLRSTKETGIERWVEIVRLYDDATYQHCLLVAGLTAAFAGQLGLSISKQRMLVQAALLHDIGKARVPLAILNKNGPLDASELTIMRRHPSDGYYMLSRQGGLEQGVLDVVLHHHEMLDGTGYPEGLRQERISDIVRIVTICDIHAALIERRTYRTPLSSDKAYDILVGMIGKLDATLVAAFRGIVDVLENADGGFVLQASA